MANYSTLKAAVADVVKTNGSQAITGANLQTVLLSIINSIGGGGYIFNGVATPSTDAGTPDQNVFYIGGAGTYANFGTSVVVPPTNIAVFKYNGSWVCEQVTVENGGVFDISAFKAVGGTLATYADLAAALGTNGANVPESVRKGGMSIKYVQTYDNKYVQYRYMETDATTAAIFTNVANWQGVDDEPIKNSKNTITSAAVALIKEKTDENSTIINNTIYNVKSLNGYTINSAGKIITTTHNYRVVCIDLFNAEQINEFKMFSSSFVAVNYGFFTEEPVLNSVSYNGTRETVEGLTITNLIVPEGCRWLVVLMGIDDSYTYEIPENKRPINDLYEKLDDVNNEINNIKYIEVNLIKGEPSKKYCNGNIGEVYTETSPSSDIFRSYKADCNADDIIICTFSTSANWEGDYILFVNNQNIIVDKFRTSYASKQTVTKKVVCPSGTSYIIVNALRDKSLQEYTLGISKLESINAEIASINNEIASINNEIHYLDSELEKGEILLPSNITVAVGRQCALNWSSIANVCEGDTSIYFEVLCDVGRNTERGYVLDVDSTMIGSHTLKINCRDSYTRKIINTYNGTLEVVTNTTLNADKNLLMIGDSRTTLSSDGVQGTSFNEANNRMISTEVKSLCDSTFNNHIKLIGTYSSIIDSSVKNLAKSGWTTSDVITELTDAGGIVPYVEESCGLGSGALLDVVTIMLGINDIGPWRGDTEDMYHSRINKIDTFINRIKSLVDTILAGYPNCAIFLVLESTSCANQDGFGYFSDARYRRTARDEMEMALKTLRKVVISAFDNDVYSTNVKLSSAGIWFDRLYGFPYIEEHPESRISVKTVDRFVNFLHPHNDGYKQIADGIYSSIVGLYKETNS